MGFKKVLLTTSGSWTVACLLLSGHTWVVRQAADVPRCGGFEAADVSRCGRFEAADVSRCGRLKKYKGSRSELVRHVQR
jgi:hypothetical protein